MINLQCPICDRPMQGREAKDLPYLPFCSQRCRQIDLGRWLGEAYRVPAEEEPESFEDQDPP